LTRSGLEGKLSDVARRPRWLAIFDGIPAGMLRRFTVDELHKMIAAGIVAEADALQLLGGRLVLSPEPVPGEQAALEHLAQTLTKTLGRDYDVGLHRPLVLGPDSEPRPDLSVLSAILESKTGRPLLLVEATAGDALRFEKTVKAAAYAVAGVPEYWIVDVERRCIEVQRSPDTASGTYRVLITLDRDSILTAEAVPGVSFAVATLLG
jgi:Uma2 family endonuclease